MLKAETASSRDGDDDAGACREGPESALRSRSRRVIGWGPSDDEGKRVRSLLRSSCESGPVGWRVWYLRYSSYSILVLRREEASPFIS